MKTRKQKEQMLENLKAKTAESKAIALCDFSSVKSKDLFELRDKLEEQGIKLLVVKNSLLKIALEKEKIEIPKEILDLPLAVAFAQDEITLSKIIWNFAKEKENLKIMGAVMNHRFEGKEKISTLALLPNEKELYARILNVLVAPKFRMIYALKYNQMKFINILSKLSEIRIKN